MWQSDHALWWFLARKGMEKPERKWAESAVLLQQPFLLPSHCNCALWEERIRGKSWNRRHELGSFCYQIIMELTCLISLPSDSLPAEARAQCWKPLSFPIPWADSFSQHSSLDRSFCCSSSSKWLLCFHNMPGHQGSWGTDDTVVGDISISKNLTNPEYWLSKVEILRNVFPSTFFSSSFQYHTTLAIVPNITQSPLWHPHLIIWGRTLNTLLTFTKT